ncbi:transglutaminase-like cysteine peptidase [Rhizomicrobium electricum]|uniref:transglutaminase-like cysteine peptidase n=1 Tax=Rhizomicrobium electricum TaxID=480070 RepID=UPI00142325ED|nr:transglutaminase-like cysteine peptidase [Rhizomicrobium electricum]NIJ47928.1 putative transglutaminase-like cysteine proteinase [Rhizomicrobium electricum]
MNRVIVGAAIMAAGLLGGCASQRPELIPVACDMPESTAYAQTPAGFAGFCLRFASQCISTPGNATVVQLTDQSWQSLSRINRKVNSDIWPEEDEKHYGRNEYWTIPTDGLGDCDDYALTKRKDLIDAGFPMPALRLAVVYSPQSGRHAVLTVKTDKGDLVLDNLRDDILPWNATGFTWIERQAASDPMRWTSLQPVMTADLRTAANATQGTPQASTGQQIPAVSSAKNGL